MAIANVTKGGSENSSNVQLLSETVLITGSARKLLRPQDVKVALERHSRGDWGDMNDFDKNANDLALASGKGVTSTYRDANQNRFLIVTSPNRARTLILLPNEYNRWC